MNPVTKVKTAIMIGPQRHDIPIGYYLIMIIMHYYCYDKFS